MEVVVPPVGGGDGGCGCHLRGVSDVPDAGGIQVGDHFVRQQVHILLLSAAVDVFVFLLGGRREIDDWHKLQYLPFVCILCQGAGFGAPDAGALRILCKKMGSGA